MRGRNRQIEIERDVQETERDSKEGEEREIFEKEERVCVCERETHILIV